LFNNTPKSKTVTFLLFKTYWVFQYLNTPFFFNIRAFSQELFLKIIGELVFHKHILPANQLKSHRNFRIFCFLTEAKVCHTIEKTPPIISRLRQLSPFVST